ncbi:unnamed protein product [Dibothriocephalus latus]|uniref:ATPase AAA-type core domain-containing protein n=1 Tax=Dibothriocephalus latus TaxID=60516 RepID=A0A3P7NZC6_DIBLA|nr:unnamed protein product [Dibothriocephalus latus]
MLDTRDGRPFYHLVLLSGPPGLGKTTLAHLLARHAGYQVIETNSRQVSPFDLRPCLHNLSVHDPWSNNAERALVVTEHLHTSMHLGQVTLLTGIRLSPWSSLFISKIAI